MIRSPSRPAVTSMECAPSYAATSAADPETTTDHLTRAERSLSARMLTLTLPRSHPVSAVRRGHLAVQIAPRSASARILVLPIGLGLTALAQTSLESCLNIIYIY